MRAVPKQRWGSPPAFRRARESLVKTNAKDGPASARLAHLDGIRAIALVGVFLFHFRVPYMNGGFLGVDIFFVLSGFLMTRALLLKVENKTFSIPQFISARAKRICPALLVTILATLVTGRYMFPVTALPRLSESSSAAAFFSSNLKFLSEDGYHDAASSSKPLLHTWSLSVEGQFYLLWSVVALLGSMEVVISVMSILCVASVAFQWVARDEKAVLFFCSWSRLYEFGVGSIALLFYDKFTSTLSSIISALGISFIAASFHFARPEHSPIGIVSAPAVVGTAFVIASPRGKLSKLLGSNYLLTYIGKISYSAYLVHWPAIVYSMSRIDNEKHALLVAFATTVFLTPILFYGVEETFRATHDTRRNRMGLLFSFALLFFILSFSAMISTWSERVVGLVENAEHRNDIKERSPVSNNLTGSKFKLRSQKFYGTELQAMLHNMSKPMGTLLWHSHVAGEPYALVIGDSFASHLIPRMYEAGLNSTSPTKQFHFMSSSGCLPTLIAKQATSNYGVPGTRPDMEAKCGINSGRAMKALRLKRARTVVVVSRWQDYMFEKSMYEAPKVEVPFLPLRDPMQRISSSLREAVKISDRVKVLGVTPTPPKNTMDCLWKQIEDGKLSDNASKVCPHHFPIREQDLTWNAGFKTYLRKNHPNVEYIDVIGNDILCTNVTCTAWDEKRGPMHIDARGHMTRQGGMAATPADLFF